MNKDQFAYLMAENKALEAERDRLKGEVEQSLNAASAFFVTIDLQMKKADTFKKIAGELAETIRSMANINVGEKKCMGGHQRCYDALAVYDKAVKEI